MARAQLPGSSTLAVAFFVVVMATQFNTSSATCELKFDVKHIDALVGSALNLTCTLNPDCTTKLNANASHLDIYWESNFNFDYFQIAQDHIRIVNDSAIQLHYQHIPDEFVVPRFQFTCLVRHHATKAFSTKIKVRRKHEGRPRVRHICVDNLEELHVGWQPVKETDKHFKMNYEVWYRNDSSTTTVFTKSENCDKQRCVITDPFNRTFPGKVLVLKIVGSVKTDYSHGILEEVTSHEKKVNLTEYIRPRKIDHISVAQNKSTQILTFEPPKTNQNISYDIKVNCIKPHFIQSKIVTRSISDFNNTTNSDGHSHEMLVTEALVGLPPYANCIVSVRSIFVNVGNWSEWTDRHFQTLQVVPLAVPQSCRCCFQVMETGNDLLFDVIVYFIPLSDEEARGRVELYRIKMIENGDLDNNATELRRNPSNVSSFLLNNLSNTIDYKINIEAKTQSGYNETLDLSASTILVPQSKLRRTSLPHKFTVVILNETSIRTTLEMKERSGINKMFLFWCKGNVERDRPCQDVLKWKEFPIISAENAIDIAYIIRLEKGESQREFIFGSGSEHYGKSSGITWSSCSFDISSSPPKPIIDSHRKTSSDVSIYLQEPSCQKISEDRGFVIGYRLFFCPLQSSDSSDEPRCVEEMKSREFYGQPQVLNLTDLSPNRNYLIVISSLSETSTSRNVTLEVATNPVDISLLPTLIIVFACVAVFAISVLVVCLKRVYLQ